MLAQTLSVGGFWALGGVGGSPRAAKLCRDGEIKRQAPQAPERSTSSRREALPRGAVAGGLHHSGGHVARQAFEASRRPRARSPQALGRGSWASLGLLGSISARARGSQDLSPDDVSVSEQTRPIAWPGLAESRHRGERNTDHAFGVDTCKTPQALSRGTGGCLKRVHND